MKSFPAASGSVATSSSVLSLQPATVMSTLMTRAQVASNQNKGKQSDGGCTPTMELLSLAVLNARLLWLPAELADNSGLFL